MIDERHEELAALYALDLLEGEQRAQFEAALGRDPALHVLVEELRRASSSLAHTASQTPPPALKDRIMASVADRAGPAGQSSKVVPFPAGGTFARMTPWAIAAGFAVLAGWMGQRYLTTRSELFLLRDREALSEVALQSTRQQLEAERIVTGRELQDLQQAVTTATEQLATTRTQLADAVRQVSERDQQLGSTRDQLASAQDALTEREARVAALSQQVDALAGASADLGRQLGEARERIARLTDDMRLQRDLAEFKITVLASLAKNSPEALAVAVWDPARQEGVLKVEKLPPLTPAQDYQLWVVDPQYPNPVDGGVFTVDPQTGDGRVTFSVKQPVDTVNAFAVTLERKGGVPKAEGPFVLLGK